MKILHEEQFGPQQQYITMQHLREQLGITRKELQRRVKRGLLPAGYRISERITLYSLAELNA